MECYCAHYFAYLAGITGDIFPGIRARLRGSWENNGWYSDDWTTIDMQRRTADDGCLCFSATVHLDEAEEGRWFHWGCYSPRPMVANAGCSLPK